MYLPLGVRLQWFFWVLMASCVSAGTALASTHGPIIGWGMYAVADDPPAGYKTAVAGSLHKLGLTNDGSIGAWGDDTDGTSDMIFCGQCNVPAPNSGFVAIAAGVYHSMAIRGHLGDVNGDGHVDVADLLLLAHTWAKSIGDPGFDASCDFNNDGTIDVLDLLLMGDNWGK